MQSDVTVQYNPRPAATGVTIPPGGKYERAYMDKHGQLFIVVHHPVHPDVIIHRTETVDGESLVASVGVAAPAGGE